MVIDITAHLRRLVLAGLPLLGTGCLPTDPSAVAPPELDQIGCATKIVYEGQQENTLSANIGFDRRDPRWSDLYAACTQNEAYCQRLCQEVLLAANATKPLGTLFSFCELGCDSEGGAVATIKYSTSVPGRRPQGFVGGTPSSPGVTLAEFWASSADVEGASVTAFAVLEADLRRHAAPAALIDRARAAQRDEARHFSLTRRLALAAGARHVPFPRPPAGPARPLEEVALENATEGCVAETYSAAVALWQAIAARDEAVRAVMAGIASDEVAHADLAWSVDAWARSRLDVPARRRLADARARAGRALVRGSAAPVDATLVRVAGLPDVAAAMQLSRTAHLTLWA
jgi:hypothetical protein